MKLHRIGNLFGVYILSVAERDEDIDLKIKHLLMDKGLPNHMPKTRRFVSYLSNFSEIHFHYHFQTVWKSILLIVRKTINFAFYFYTEDKSGGNHLLVELFFIRWLSIAFLASCIIWAYDRKTSVIKFKYVSFWADALYQGVIKKYEKKWWLPVYRKFKRSRAFIV